MQIYFKIATSSISTDKSSIAFYNTCFVDQNNKPQKPLDKEEDAVNRKFYNAYVICRRIWHKYAHKHNMSYINVAINHGARGYAAVRNANEYAPKCRR